MSKKMRAITQCEAMLALAQAVYPPGHSEVRFAQWMVDNQGQIQEAITELGIEPPKPGPDLYRRLKEIVMLVLESQWPSFSRC